MNGKPLRDRALLAVLEEPALAACQLIVQYLGKAIVIRRSEQKIDIRIFVLNIVYAVLLRDHAAADSDKQLGIFFFYMLELPRDRQRFKLRMLAYRAGVYKNKIGILGLRHHRVAHLLRHSAQSLAVCLVLLTAEGLHIYPSRAVSEQLAHPRHIAVLRADLLLRYSLDVSFHIKNALLSVPTVAARLGKIDII